MSASPEKDNARGQAGKISKANTTRGKHNARSTKKEALIRNLALRGM